MYCGSHEACRSLTINNVLGDVYGISKGVLSDATINNIGNDIIVLGYQGLYSSNNYEINNVSNSIIANGYQVLFSRIINNVKEVLYAKYICINYTQIKLIFFEFFD